MLVMTDIRRKSEINVSAYSEDGGKSQLKLRKTDAYHRDPEASRVWCERPDSLATSAPHAEITMGHLAQSTSTSVKS